MNRESRYRCVKEKLVSFIPLLLILALVLPLVTAASFTAERVGTDDVDLSAPDFLPHADDAWAYDKNRNGVIDRVEAVQALVDYFGFFITRAQAIQVLTLYFASGIVCSVEWSEDVRITETNAECFYPTLGVAGSTVHLAWVDQRHVLAY